MDGQALQFADATFDAALSVLGIILFPDAERGLAEMRRVVRPGGRVSVVTWTQPQNYELATELRAAIQAVWPEQPPAPLPAQLRYREEADFRALFRAAGLSEPAIATVTARLEAPSARWLSERIAFAPGMAAMMAGLGERAPAVLERFVEQPRGAPGQGTDRPLRRGVHRHGAGPVTFWPVASEHNAERQEPSGPSVASMLARTGRNNVQADTSRGCTWGPAGGECRARPASALVFTAIPDEDETRLVERFTQYAKYFEGKLGVPVKYLPVKSYPAAVTAFTNNQVQFAWFGGLTGVQARLAVPGSQAIAQGAEDLEFKSYIIAHASTGLTRCQGLPEGHRGQDLHLRSPRLDLGPPLPRAFHPPGHGQGP